MKTIKTLIFSYMFAFFKSKENKRIEELFNIYKSNIQKGIKKEEALVDLCGDIITRGIHLVDTYGFREKNLESKKKFLNDRFSGFEVASYDIFRLIEFIVAWEFPEKYNKMPTIEDIRTKKDILSILEKQVKEIGQNILVNV